MENEIIGTKDIEKIKGLVKEDKLLEAFFSIIIKIQWQLWANFHNKFHLDIGKTEKIPKRNAKKMWEGFTKKVNNFSALIFLSYSVGLIDEQDYKTIDKLRRLRNDIAHKLTYHGKQEGVIITKNKVKRAIDDGIKIIQTLNKTEHEIIFGRK